MEEHSTNHYDIPGLVLRRGQPFSFTVTFNRNFDTDQDQLYVRLAIGSRSMISKRTQIRVLVDGTPNGNGWVAKKIPIEDEEDKKANRISLQIESPSNAIIGKYILLLEIRPINKDDKDSLTKQNLTLFLLEVDIYFLFNPWIKDDVCTLPSSEQIAEYVMNEHGQIYLGSSDEPRAIPWYFGQFERPALYTALKLLDDAHLPPQNRIDPSIILRIISSKICSNPGVNNGIFPSSLDIRPISPQNNGYTSSTAILKQYLALNGRSVEGGSGSNWQHAAILCTLSRSLGIPCRIATVYNAACRADGTENNDMHWDTKQRPLQRLNFDLICSARVWNECWMRRNDLPNPEQDWQIIDSTPVQMCDGIRRTGPCPVSSLRKGELGFRWDSPFIHSSINGNKSHWIVYPDGYMELLDVQENMIASKIITRSLTNEFEPEDITDLYKNPTKSLEEKDTLAARLKHDVNIELKIPKDIQFGDSILFELNAVNKSDQERTITTALTICIINSADQKLLRCYNQPIETLNLESGKDGNIQLKIRPEQYIKHGIQENIVVKYYINAQIKETDQTFTRDDNIIFNKDDIVKPILHGDVIEMGKPVSIEIQIANTLSRTLNNGRIYIDGLGINEMLLVNRSFAPKESTSLHTKVYPTRVGVSRLYVTFISDSVCSLTQSIPLEIISEPIKERDEPTKNQDEPTGKQDESNEKQDELTKNLDETTEKQEETNKKQDEPTNQQEELTKKQNESTESQAETAEKRDELAEKKEELAENQDETTKKQDGNQDEPLLQNASVIPPKTDEQAEVKTEVKETALASGTPDNQDEPPISEEQKALKTDEQSEVKTEGKGTVSPDHPTESPVTEELKPPKTDEPPETQTEGKEKSLESDTPGHQGESPINEEQKPPITDEQSEVKNEGNETVSLLDAPDHQAEPPVSKEPEAPKTDDQSEVKTEGKDPVSPSDVPDNQAEPPISEEPKSPKPDDQSEVKTEGKETVPPDHQAEPPASEEQKPPKTDEQSEVKPEGKDPVSPSDVPDHQTEPPVSEEPKSPKPDDQSEVKTEVKDTVSVSDALDNQAELPVSEETKAAKPDDQSEVKPEGKEALSASDAPAHQAEPPVSEEPEAPKPDDQSEVKTEGKETVPPDHQAEPPTSEEEKPPKTDDQSEAKTEGKEAVSVSDAPDHQVESQVSEEQKPLTTASSLSPVEGENQDQNPASTAQTKSDSTASIDKDKMAVDSLDIPTEGQ